MRWLLLAVAALVAATAVLLGVPAAPAEAHDRLVSTDPADGSTVASPPASVELTFDQPALAIGSQVVVTGPRGSRVSAGRPRLVDTTVTQDLGGTLPAGSYTVEWRVTSADGHPVSGRFRFTSSSAGTGAAHRPDAPATSSGAGSSSASGAVVWSVAGVAAVVLVAGTVVVVMRRGRARRLPSSARPTRRRR